MKPPIRIAVTGATGQICYSLLYRIAAGEMLGKDQPIILQLHDITDAQPFFDAIVMELYDCAFPLLTKIVTTDNLIVWISLCWWARAHAVKTWNAKIFWQPMALYS